MRLDGATYREIADAFGVSYQRIQQLLPNGPSRNRNKIIYLGIEKWMEDNRVTVVAFSKKCNSHYNNMHSILAGKHAPRKDTIDRILNVTGLTYEEAFRIKE